MAIKPEVLLKHGVKIKSRPDTEEEIAKKQKHDWRNAPRTRTRINLTLDPDALEIARQVGKGNASRGIDRALFAFKERSDAVPRTIRRK